MTMPPWTEPSAPTLAVFVGICGAVVAAFVALARRAGLPRGPVALGVVLWLGATGFAGASGILRPGPVPPPLMVFVLAVQGTAAALALTAVGGRIASTAPLWALVGVQGFRLPLELVLHRWHAEGVVPVQMTFEGWNFDVVTGVACVLAGGWLARRPDAPEALPVAWTANLVGTGLLLAVMAIAVTSAPGPLYRFTDAPPLQLPLHFPTAWIVSVCVAGALFFHLVTFRALLRRRGVPHARTGPVAPPA